MSRWNSRASASMDLDAYDEDRNPEAVPLPIEDDETTARLEYCLSCGRPLDGECAHCPKVPR